MKRIVSILLLVAAGFSLQAQTVLSRGRLDTIWGSGQVPRGANLTNTWYTLYPGGSGGGISGTLTTDYVPIASGAHTLTNSILKKGTTWLELPYNRSFEGGDDGGANVTLNLGISTTTLINYGSASTVHNIVGSWKFASGAASGDVWLSSASGIGSWSTLAAAGIVGGSGTQNFYLKWNNAGGTTSGNALLSDDGTNIKVPSGKYITSQNTAKSMIDFGTTGSEQILMSIDGGAFAKSAIGMTTSGTTMAWNLAGGGAYHSIYTNGHTFYGNISTTFGQLLISSANSGTLKLVDGNQGAGKILMDNGAGTGVVAWSSLSGAGIVGGSGTTNYIPKWSSSSALGNSVMYDDGTNIGIGTTSPLNKLDVAGTFKLSFDGTVGAKALVFGNGSEAYINYGSYGTVNVNQYSINLTHSAAIALTATSSDITFNAPTVGMYGSSKNLIGSAAGDSTVIRGNVRLNNGTQGSGKVLTSNANGVATWQAPSSDWSLTGNALGLSSSFLGTTDNTGLVFKTNSTAVASIDPPSGGLATFYLGLGSTIKGSLAFYNTGNSAKVTINSGLTSSSYTMVLPTAQGAASTLLTNDGSGNLSWSAPATSGTVTHTGSLTSGQLLQGNGTADITVGDLTGDVTTSGTLATTIGAGKVTNSMLAGSIAASKLVGTDIATVGTITSGVWHGTKVSEVYGGTNQATYATGDILYASAANTLSKLAAGSDGNILTLASGVPSWAAASGGNPFSDASALVKNSSDATKLAIFSAAGITTGTTRTYTLPNFNGTFATLAGTEAFTNKTITSPTITSPTITVGSDATGDIYYNGGSGAFTRLADVAAGSYLRSGGAGAAPVYSTLILPNAATTGQVVFGSATNTYGGSTGFTFDNTNSSISVGTGATGATTAMEAKAGGTGAYMYRVTNTNGGASTSAGLVATIGSNSVNFRQEGSGAGYSGIAANVATLDASGPQLALSCANASGIITFHTAASYTERMRILSGGNVGIGSTAPAHELDVIKSQAVTSAINIGNPSASNGAYAQLSANSSAGGVNLGMVGGGTTTSGEYVQSQAYNMTNSAGFSFGTNNASGIIRFYSGSGVEGMRLSSGGNVGIGTTTTTYKLNVAGDIGVSSTGNTVRINTGTAATTCAGTGTLSSGTVTVSTTCAVTGGLIFLTNTLNPNGISVGTIVNATSFVVNGTGSDTFNWWVVKSY